MQLPLPTGKAVTMSVAVQSAWAHLRLLELVVQQHHFSGFASITDACVCLLGLAPRIVVLYTRNHPCSILHQQ